MNSLSVFLYSEKIFQTTLTDVGVVFLRKISEILKLGGPVLVEKCPLYSRGDF